MEDVPFENNDELRSHIESVLSVAFCYEGVEYFLIRDPNPNNYTNTYTIKNFINPNLEYYYDNSTDAISHFIELEFTE